MNMPGFSAEASIGKLSDGYSARGKPFGAGRPFVGPAIALRSRFISLLSLFGSLDFDCYRACASHCGSDAWCQNNCLNECRHF